MSSTFPERIIPSEELDKGVLASHFKRYVFAEQYCAGKHVLDVGCGVGYGSHRLGTVAATVNGIDIAGEAIEYAQTHYTVQNVAFHIMDAHVLAYQDASFDVVCCFEMIEHLQAPKKFLTEVARVIKPDGVLIVSTPQVPQTRFNSPNPYHTIEFDRQDFEKILGRYFGRVEIYGQRRRQTEWHYWLQRLDVLNLRFKMPRLMVETVSHTINNKAWHELDLDDMLISKEKIKRATELIGVCWQSKRSITR